MALFWLHDFESLLDAAAPAVLTTYRQDGTAVPSPVWYRLHDDAFEVVIAQGRRQAAPSRPPSAVLSAHLRIRSPVPRAPGRG